MTSLKQEQSKKYFQRGLECLVGGVNSPVRAFKRVGGHPLLVSKAQGEFIWDVDGNQYIDFLMSFGPHLFGHRHVPIVAALETALKSSSCYGVTSPQEIEWAEQLLKFFPHYEKVRATSTGTEACATAIRLARGITRRDLVVKFSGHYHGHVDSLMVDAGSGIATLSSEVVADSAGIPASLASLSRVCEFNNIQSVEEVFEKNKNQIACVILEPVMGNMGVVPPAQEFLQALRSLCTQHGALLIFDEVMTGLRVHKHSAQGRYHVKPDLTTLGKIVGGGLPLAAVVGPAKYMDQLAPLGSVYQAGTLSGNPMCVSAGLAMMQEIEKQQPYEKLEEISCEIEKLFIAAAANHHVVIRTERVGSMMSVFFRKNAVKNSADTRDINEGQFKAFFWALLEEGIMIPPSPFEAFFISTAHANMDKRDFSNKLDRVFKKVAEIG